MTLARACAVSRRHSPELCIAITPSKQGRREDRVPACTHGPRAKGLRESALTTGTGGNTPAFPAQWFYGLYAFSPVNHPVCHRRPFDAQASSRTWRQGLGAPGPRDFAVRKRSPLVGRRACVHCIPASRVVTIAIRPLFNRGGMPRTLRQFRISGKRNIFARTA
jgi:hypothetical protein